MGLLSKWLHNIRTKLVSPYVEGDILDVGCGPATNLLISQHKIKKYVGIEYDHSLVKELNEKYREASFCQKDLDLDNFDFDMKFDRVLLIAVIEHIFNQKHLLNECLKCLKPDGKIIITTPTIFGNDIIHRLGASIGLFSKDASEDHIIIYNKKRFEILANEFNLKIKKYKKFELGCNQLVILTRK
jgi:SAM-dependent methyltransferase